MSSTFGQSVTTTIFGQSHSAAIGCVIDGLPAGIEIDLDELQSFLDRRAPGKSDTSTTRKEADTPKILSGLVDGHTCGAPLAAMIENTNTRSQDYDQLRRIPRPGHADYAAYLRYANYHDVAGGGHFSGRLTAPLCIAGGIAKQALQQAFGMQIVAHIALLGPAEIEDEALDSLDFNKDQQDAILSNSLPCIDADVAEAMHDAILEARDEEDSIGGIVECVAYGMPAGIGSPMACGLENRIAALAFGIPAVKGIEFGAGYASAISTGSDNNDPYRMINGEVCPITNNAGGILGGISTGMPITMTLAIKPTPSIAQEQKSVDLKTGKDADLSITGRHDPCIVPRAVPVAEAAMALALLDALVFEGAYPNPKPQSL